MADDADAKLLVLQAEHDAAWAELERANAMLTAAETPLDVPGIIAAAKLQGAAVDHLRKIEARIRKARAHSPYGLAIKARIVARSAGCNRNWKGHPLARAVLVLTGEGA